ncbi:hypothetical protein [Clostridium tagluense]|uniref:hypothetical protein n=1 Tax=Clostridium tagluense TaxID=360422 RepID=UPI001C0DE899|nr:hypothetical protein [Clostridium tagluense]MBU3129009.1 hypothetical protein [Clostridium tagluense]
MAKISREDGIAKLTVTVWINKLKQISVDKDKIIITAAEYQKMLKKMAIREEENKLFKKVTAIFARE